VPGVKKDLEKYRRQKIVLDTRSSWIYIGVLESVSDTCAVLVDVDVHDGKDSPTSKELYVLESKTTGIKSNRHRVYVNLDYVVSFSALEEVKNF
jgi:small nuclear ribonucleoprotein (snRNP)-like protein